MFNNWSALAHTLFVGSLAYVVLIVLLRISGKRTLAKWNAFDFIVTVAFGSILATMLLSTDTSLIQGALGFGLLVLLQFFITWLSIRSPIVQNWIKTKPTLLVYRGELLYTAMRQERVTEGEIRATLRNSGIAAIESVDAVVLETNGSFSVIEQLDHAAASALVDVQGYPGRDLSKV